MSFLPTINYPKDSEFLKIKAIFSKKIHQTIFYWVSVYCSPSEQWILPQCKIHIFKVVLEGLTMFEPIYPWNCNARSIHECDWQALAGLVNCFANLYSMAAKLDKVLSKHIQDLYFTFWKNPSLWEEVVIVLLEDTVKNSFHTIA